MAIYKPTADYRKVWTNHFGDIPTDNNGRSFEIHHIDGNRRNNNINNLICVSIAAHYQIHKNQKDWGACYAIKARMNTSPAELSRLSRLCQQERIRNGTHHWLGGEMQRRNANLRVTLGTHHFLGSQNNDRRIKDGTHNFLKRSDGTSVASDRVNAGTHNWLDGTATRLRNLKKINEGTHPWLGGEMQRKNAKERLECGTHPSQLLKKCAHCGVTCNIANYTVWHGENCKVVTGRKRSSKKPQASKTCPVCSKTMRSSHFTRYGHGTHCNRVSVL